jgi:predicted GNAT family N-acyltransferase
MKIVNTYDTSSRIYSDAVSIRHIVFVDEQQVPPEIEIDEYEAQCVHFVLYNAENSAVATARLLPDKEHAGLATLQRMAVLKEYRSHGYGRDMIREVEKFAAQNSFSEIVLHAQITAQGFYSKMEYVPFGDEFEEAGIRHISMKKIIK